MGNYDGSIKMNTEIETKDLNSQMLSVANAIKRSETEITRLNARMDELANKKIPTSEYAKLQKELETTQSKFEQVAQEVADFEKIGADKRFTPFRMARDEAQELRMKIEEIRGAMFELEENGRAFSSGMNTEEYSKAASKVERLTDDIEVGKKRLSEMQEKQKPVTEEFSRMRKVTGKIAAVLNTVSNTGKKAFRALGNVAKKAFSVVTSGAKHGSGMLSTFTSRLKGLALSLFVFNWLSKGFNAMISGMKSGFTNFASYSSSFAESVQGMKNALSTLGNQLAAAFAPIVQMVIPWLSQLISAISTAMTYVAQFIAVIGGSSTFTRAKKVQDGYNKSLNDTASAAKKASGALAKFDDLDVLAKKDTGAGAGAAGGAGNLFEEVPVDNKFKDLWKWLKDMWEKSDFYDLGKMLGDKLAEALAKIPWDKIKTQARKIAHSLATLINGFIEGEFNGVSVAWWIGHTLAEAINTGFEFVNEFVHTLNWAGIGEFIADTLNGFFESLDWWEIRDTFVTAAEKIAEGINAFIDSFNWENISDTISRALNTISETIYKFFSEVKWDELGQKIGEQIRETIEKTDFEEIGRAIGSIIQAAIDFVKSLVSEINFADVVGAIFDTLKGLFEAADVGDIAGVILTALALQLIARSSSGLAGVAEALFGGIASASTAEAASGAAGTIMAALTDALAPITATIVGGAICVDLVLDWSTDLAEESGHNPAQLDELQEKYEGFSGKLALVKEMIKATGRALQGLPFADSCQGFEALNQASQYVADGFLLTDTQMRKMQDAWQLTDEDMEMLRQEMLEMHPELLDIANAFPGLYDASAETLQGIKRGFDEIENSGRDYSDVLDDLTNEHNGLTDEARTFFENMQNGAQYLDAYKNSVENASEATSQFSSDVAEAGENIAAGLTEGMNSADVETPTKSFFTRVKEALANVFDMHSPAKNMEPDGENILLGVLNGFKAKFDEFTTAIEELYANVKLAFSNAWEEIKENTIEIWTSIQEWFTEYWILFTEQIHETLENIVLFFTETWENIQLLFQAFLEFIDTVFVASWQEFWTNAETIFQVFKDALYKLIDAIKELYTGLMKSVKLLIDGDWKGAWDNAKKVFSNFKEKVSGIVDEIKSLLQSFFDWISSMVEAAIEKIKSIGESIGNGISHVFGGGGSGGISAQSDTFEVPALASGDVIRGGNPFLAILGDQPKGQTNVEAPLSTIKQAVREELSGMNYGGGFNPTISLNVDGQEFARLTLNDILNEAARQGYDVSVLGVT